MKKILLSTFVVFLSTALWAQDWVVFNTSTSDLPGDNCNGLYVQNGNTVWVATNQGVARYFQGNWTTFTLPAGGILPNFLSSVRVDKDGDLWAGAFQNGASEYISSNWTSQCAGNVMDVHADPTNLIWIATSDQGLFSLDGSNNLTQYSTNITQGFNSNVVNCVTDDDQGNLWVGFDPQGNWLGGMAKFDGNTWSRWNTSLNNLPDNRINRIAFNAGGKLYLASDAGLIEGSNTTWSLINSGNSDLPNDLVNTVSIASDGRIWIGTEGGLAILDPSDGSWTVFTKGNSDLPDNSVREIGFDAAGHTWIATKVGVAIYKEGGTNVSIEEPLWAKDLKFVAGPNPIQAGEALNLHMDLPVTAEVLITMTDLNGRFIKQQSSQRLNPGSHRFSWQTEGLSSGIYLIQLETAGIVRYEKLMIH